MARPTLTRGRPPGGPSSSLPRAGAFAVRDAGRAGVSLAGALLRLPRWRCWSCSCGREPHGAAQRDPARLAQRHESWAHRFRSVRPHGRAVLARRDLGRDGAGGTSPAARRGPQPDAAARRPDRRSADCARDCASARSGSPAATRAWCRASARTPVGCGAHSGRRQPRVADRRTSRASGSSTARTTRSCGSTPRPIGVTGEAIQVGDEPTAVAYGHKALWVTNSGDDTVSRVDPAHADGSWRRSMSVTIRPV